MDAVPKYVGEFVGTYMLIFTVGCNVLSGSPVWAGTSIGCVLMVMIYALGGVSGANFNPAVTLALGITKSLGCQRSGMEWMWTVPIYMLVQFVAGILAALSYGALFYNVFNLAPSTGFGILEAGLAEFLYTLMLCFVVLNVATAICNDGNQFYGLAIGFVIIAGAYGAGAISGGCFNPAVALAIDLSSAGVGFKWGLIYPLFEFLGAAAAAGLFRFLRPDNFLESAPKAGAKPADYNPNYSLAVRCVSEFVGTFYLVVTVGLNVLANSPAPVWSIAASLMCMIYALGNCSGGHFNPAVTLAIFLRGGKGRPTPVEVGAYMGSQILGGIVAAFTYASMHHFKTFALEPGKGFNYGHVAAAEIIATFTLCFVVLSVATVKSPLSEYFGLAIASCVTTGGYAIGAVSGGSLNPAVSFGISTSHIVNGGLWYNCLIYTIFELIGGAMAAGLFRVVRPEEYADEKAEVNP